MARLTTASAWRSNPELFGEDIRQRLETGAAFTSTDYILARRTQSLLRYKFTRFFEEYDLAVDPDHACD
jgi:aspartyl-tRNA(Asn)/glutamyl-tRNA(Gln) amidotransferase subunit A